MKKRFLILSTLSTVLFLKTAPYVQADNTPFNVRGVFGNGNIGNLFITDPSLADHAILSIINLSFAVAGLITLAYMIYAGFSYVLGRGDRSVIEKTQKTMTHAIIGLIIVIFSYFIAMIAASLVGIQGSIFISFSNLFHGF